MILYELIEQGKEEVLAQKRGPHYRSGLDEPAKGDSNEWKN